MSGHGGRRTRRAVIREDGERFETVGKASEAAYGSPGFESNIRRACLKGYRAGGCRWRYEDEEER